jgi:outer membrane protein W
MKYFGKKSRSEWSMIALTVVSVGIAQAELVLDEESATAAKVEDREATRKVVKSAQTVETQSAMETETVSAPVMLTTPPVVAESAPSSKSELVRRNRMREEMKNEDLLQQRLEELRLRDEQQRSEKLLKSSGLTADEDAEKPASLSAGTAAPVMKEEQVVAPITETLVQKDVVSTQQSSVTQMSVAPVGDYASETSKSGNTISIMPKVGFASISNSDNYNFDSRFTAGLSLGFTVSEYVGLELGYAFSEYALSPGNRAFAPGYSMASYYNQLEYKQNTFDIGMKLYFVNSNAKVRPYVGAGAAYSMGYVNYNKRTRDMMAMYPQFGFGRDITDYQLNQIMGTLSGGLDLKVSSKVSIGASYKYLLPISSYENSQLNNFGFSNGLIPMNAYDFTKEYARGSLRDSNIHLIQVGASFAF